MARLWLAVSLLLCAAVVLYPLVSNLLYERRQDRIITEYRENVVALEPAFLKKEREACVRHNEALQKTSVLLLGDGGFSEAEEQAALESLEGYRERLDPESNGIMAYLEIPAIRLKLPVYHDTTEAVLQKGLGHVPQTSLPVGGEGTHAVITGHSGMTEKRLFSDLPALEIGDRIRVHVLGEVLCYEVDRVQTVLPGETEALQIEAGKDLLTLVTCVPQNINTHRLLVRGVRVEDVPVTDPEKGTWDEAVDEEPTKARTSTWLTTYGMAVVGGVAVALVTWLIYRFLRRQGDKRCKKKAKAPDNRNLREGSDVYC